MDDWVVTEGTRHRAKPGGESGDRSKAARYLEKEELQAMFPHATIRTEKKEGAAGGSEDGEEQEQAGEGGEKNILQAMFPHATIRTEKKGGVGGSEDGEKEPGRGGGAGGGKGGGPPPHPAPNRPVASGMPPNAPAPVAPDPSLAREVDALIVKIQEVAGPLDGRAMEGMHVRLC